MPSPKEIVWSAARHARNMDAVSPVRENTSWFSGEMRRLPTNGSIEELNTLLPHAEVEGASAIKESISMDLIPEAYFSSKEFVCAYQYGK